MSHLAGVFAAPPGTDATDAASVPASIDANLPVEVMRRVPTAASAAAAAATERGDDDSTTTDVDVLERAFSQAQDADSDMFEGLNVAAKKTRRGMSSGNATLDKAVRSYVSNDIFVVCKFANRASLVARVMESIANYYSVSETQKPKWKVKMRRVAMQALNGK